MPDLGGAWLIYEHPEAVSYSATRQTKSTSVKQQHNTLKMCSVYWQCSPCEPTYSNRELITKSRLGGNSANLFSTFRVVPNESAFQSSPCGEPTASHHQGRYVGKLVREAARLKKRLESQRWHFQ
eukprot:1158076-Pelagomonas_calceolata.AAC.8